MRAIRRSIYIANSIHLTIDIDRLYIVNLQNYQRPLLLYGKHCWKSRHSSCVTSIGRNFTILCMARSGCTHKQILFMCVADPFVKNELRLASCYFCHDGMLLGSQCNAISVK